MRTTLFALCFFIFAYRAAGIADTDGEPVRNAGGAYYLVPVSDELSGGLGPATIWNENVPKSVVLDTNLTYGVPVRFSSPLRIGFIKPSMLLNIKFVSDVPELQVWKVDLEFPFGWTIKVSDERPFMGPFQVHPARNATGHYQIVYWPEGGELGGYLGILYTGGFYRLIVKDHDPFIFKIKKATETSATMSII